jgi:hypothetical protein
VGTRNFGCSRPNVHAVSLLARRHALRQKVSLLSISDRRKLISCRESGKKEGPAGLGTRLAQRTNKIKMKITELALSSSFDDFLM